MPPVEPVSDGEIGYNTARSEVNSDGGSHVGEAPPPKHTQPGQSSSHDDDLEVEELPDDDDDEHEPEDIEIGKMGGFIKKKTSQDPPADVQPIGHIPRIPSIQPVGSNPHPTPPPEESNKANQKKVPIYEAKKDHLVGMTIDEWGDIVDDQGEVLGRVEGNLPSMIGRQVSNARGDVLGDDNVLLGYVAELGPGKGHPEPPKEDVPTWSLEEVEKAMAATGKGIGGLRVDPFGNILDAQGNSVGSFHDNLSGFGRKNGTFPEHAFSSDAEESKPQGRPESRPKQPRAGPAPRSEKPEGTATQRRDKAQSQRKEKNPLNPSDIFLDVKSTTEGIQLTIRIPTVFNSGGSVARPKIIIE